MNSPKSRSRSYWEPIHRSVPSFPSPKEKTQLLPSPPFLDELLERDEVNLWDKERAGPGKERTLT